LIIATERDDSLQFVSVRLDGKNYSYWSYVMRNFFKGKKMWGYVSETSMIPKNIEEGDAVLIDTWHYKKTGENQRNYRQKYSVGSYYRRTKFRLKICWFIPTEYIRWRYGQYIPMKIFRRYIPTISPTDYFFRRFYRRNDRGIQTEIAVQ